MAPPRESSHEAESPSPPQSPIASTSKLSSPILIPNEIATVIPPELSGGRAKKFPCLEVGCGKAFTRPSRLEEHNRSHTGEVSFETLLCCSNTDQTIELHRNPSNVLNVLPVLVEILI